MTHNELIVIGVTLASLLGCLFSYKLGRRWIEGYIIASLLSIYTMGVVFVEAFGQQIPLGTPMYAGIFLATDMLSERYGKNTALRMVRISFMAMLVFQLFIQLALLSTPIEAFRPAYEGLEAIAGISLRMFFAGAAVYIIAQTFDVKFYHYLHKKLGEKHLWLRNNLSTMTSQLIDTILFFNIAFYGLVENTWSLVLVAYTIKVLVAMIDTPFMYLSKKITPLDMADAEKLGRVYKAEN